MLIVLSLILILLIIFYPMYIHSWQGFDPSKVRDDAVFVWHGGKYEPLTAAIYEEILADRMRL